MIKSFKCKYTKKLFDGKSQKKFSQAVNNVGKRKLDMLEASYDEADLRVPPSNRFEHLKGDLKGFCSIRINEQYRIVFRFENSNAYDVYIDDYHK
ncbi:type II toxin-antitoxin system RelE/ParE family toxin [Sulfurimonas lithotrophica]|uniref:Type II toxin-antitoxin system RelE/ParE family toxin n=1 Tax=Sulfurimonas lithotrophica TaxID=2590022 RepID=A0A5P8P0A8_9BACT|nr:type II toxin-antitoxin system RelE/ParE family toxin [Sulfurimonas lithotrophica]QFR49041.1 type II toxin-antitoxin system RelE/ParE family toxin [Sulfurimonas lithotrophica]